jgi:hypothetical protein
VKGEVDRCSHCKWECHTQDKCWVLHPHLRPKRVEAAGRIFFLKTLDGGEGDKRGLVSMKGDSDEVKSSRNEAERLDRLESLLLALLRQKSSPGMEVNLFQQMPSTGPVNLSPSTFVNVEKTDRASPNSEKMGYIIIASNLEMLDRNNYLTIGLRTKNTAQNYTKWVLD